MIKKRPRIADYISFVLIFFVSAMGAGAQVLTSVLPEEPPSSLFSAQLGDADVEAFAQGFWEASILSSGAWSIGSDDSGFNAVPFLFTQTPDLYVFLRFKQKWLFEAYVTEEATDNKFSLAFEGDDNDFVKHARLGNAGITMPAYPYMSFGSPDGSFGAALRAYDADRDVSIDAMIRWDGLDWKTRTFFGAAEAVETTLAPSDHLRGRRFVLPPAPLLAVTLTDTTSSGTRTLRSDEYSVSLATGVVILAAEPKGKLIATYTDSTTLVHIETLYEVTTDADGATIRVTSAYEARNLYALSDTSSARQLFVRSLATGTTDTAYTVTRVSSGLIQVVKGSATPGTADYMMPFYAETPWSYAEDSDVEDSVSTEGFSVVARVVESVDSIVLDQETVAGTISVYRDGVESASFEYDEDSCTLVLSPAPRSGESIQIRYATSSSDRSSGALAFGVGSRFPWLGLDWSTAVGGRWPLFGLGYDEGGELQSAWTGVSASVTKKTESASFEVEGMARYLRAGASGLYRVAGMEDYGDSSWLVPFRQVSPVTDGIAAATALDTDLGAEESFSELIDTLHSTGYSNRALSISAGTLGTGSATFARYVDYVPLSSYGRLSFFVKADSTSGATLTLSVGDGSGGGSVTVPLDALDGDGWHKVTLDLDPVAAVRVYSGDGSVVTGTGATGSFSIPDSAGLVAIGVTGLTAGGSGTILVDEIVLEGAADGFSGLVGASFSVGDRKTASGAWIEGAASGVLDGDPTIASSLEAGWRTASFDLSASLSPAYASDVASAGVGYVVAVPGKSATTRFVDEYSRDEILDRYARSLEGALKAGGFSAGLSAASTEESSAFGQRWKARAAYGDIASVSASAGLDAPVGLVSGLGVADAWTESWSLLAPRSESSASSRRLELSATALGSSLTATATRIYDDTSPARTDATVKASLPLRFGALSFAPYYARSTALERASSASSFRGDASEFLSDAGAAAALWSALPLVELWSGDAFYGFAEFSDGASSAEHSAEVGLEVRRPMGYGLVDLFAPSAVTAAYARAIEMNADTTVESSVVELTLSGGAANIFSKSGAVPVFDGVAFDEYSYKTAFEFSYYPSDGAVLPSVTSNVAVSMEGAAGSVFALTSTSAYARTRSARPWSETLGLALTTKPGRTWLGDLAGTAIRSRTEPAEKTWVSTWLDDVLGEAPTLKDSFSLEGMIGRTQTSSAPLVARLALDYSTRVSAGTSLSIGVGAGLWQLLTIYADGAVWGVGYEFSLDAKVVF
ncbi:MAG: hypothetical protein CVV47_04725 [Spirochaetae bacterium HGW-Spirochaetae-3]|jgi:hypothetical protein|nr:MAG: hypothetical protein CVV47_04725 [Spirochaetae bacterium HGW-Spirochaetae-3]